MRNSHVLSPRRLAPFAMLIILIVAGISAGAFASVFPGSTHASPCDVSNAFANTSDPYLNARAQDFAAMSHFVEDPNGQTGTFNGSCCTGLMQINTRQSEKSGHLWLPLQSEMVATALHSVKVATTMSTSARWVTKPASPCKTTLTRLPIARTRSVQTMVQAIFRQRPV